MTADLARRRGELSKLLGALALYRRQPPPALLVSPDKARDAVRGAILARSLTPGLTRRAQALAPQRPASARFCGWTTPASWRRSTSIAASGLC